MRLNIQDNGFENHSDLLRRTVAGRIELDSSGIELNIVLCMDESIGAAES